MSPRDTTTGSVLKQMIELTLEVNIKEVKANNRY